MRHFVLHNLFKVNVFQVFLYFYGTFPLKGLCKTAGTIFILYTYVPEDFNKYSSKFTENFQVIVLNALSILNIILRDGPLIKVKFYSRRPMLRSLSFKQCIAR